MGKRFLNLLAAAFFTYFAFSAEFISAKDLSEMDNQKIQVLKKKKNVYIRSYFSPDKDVVIKVGGYPTKRNGCINFVRTGLIDKLAPMTEQACMKARSIHNCGDDATPWNFNGTYIGANHGCYAAVELTIQKHGLTPADIGSEWHDSSGKKFFLIKIIDPNKIWLLSENTGKGDIWRFNTKFAGNELKNASGGALKISKQICTQIIPASRILKQSYLIDGKTPLPDDKPVSCSFLDIIDDYDIIAPDSLLEKIRKNQGKNVRFNTKDLDSVITMNIRYRFQPRGACTILSDAKLNREIRIGYAGFIQTVMLAKGGYKTHEYHIPKTKPFEYRGVKYDFSGFQDFSQRLKHPVVIGRNAKFLVDPNDPPDRWIQFLGNGKEREVGYVVGYSLLDGITRPQKRVKNVNSVCFIHVSNKTYPYAIDSAVGKTIPAGTEFSCLAYRQYFSPSDLSSKASSSYLHKQKDAWLLYLHYHQPVAEDLIKLPGDLNKKQVSVVEKSAGIKLLSKPELTPDGIRISSEKPRGYIVLKIK
jgi:hypothetical protein